MQRVSTPKRFYIDHSTDHKIEVRAISCPWPPKREAVDHETRQATTQAERLFSAGRLVRGGFLRKK